MASGPFAIEATHKYPLHIFRDGAELDARTVTFTPAPAGVIEVRGDSDSIQKVFPLAAGEADLSFAVPGASGSAHFTVAEGEDGELVLTLDAGQPL